MKTMPRKGSRLRRLLLSIIVCLLIGCVFASELPEELTLTNDTSNDYILTSATVLKPVQLLRYAGPAAKFLLSNVASRPLGYFLPAALEAPGPHGESLFILHSVLRT